MAGSSTVCLDREAAGRYVLSRRTPLGGYSFYRTPEWGVEEPNAPDTLAALECLQMLDWPIPEPAATVAWLRGLQNDDGGYPTLTIGWAALRALALLGAAPDRSPAAWLDEHEEALARPIGARDWQGTLREALHVAELRRIGVAPRPETVEDPFSQLLDAARDPRGAGRVPEPISRPRPSPSPSRGRPDCQPRNGPTPSRSSATARTRSSACALPRKAARPGSAPCGADSSSPKDWSCSRRYPGAVGACLADLQRADGGLGARHFAISTLRDTWRGLDAAQLLDHFQIDQLQEDKS